MERMRIQQRLAKTFKKIDVQWIPPPPGVIKFNSDGISRGNPGEAACRGVFRDSNGVMLGGGSQFLLVYRLQCLQRFLHLF